MFPSCRAVLVLALVSASGLAMGWAGPAWGQACCASAGLVAPTRLRSYEDYAVGLQGKGRSTFGSFDAGGGYRGSGGDASEWGLQQDLFAVARVVNRGQVALVLPFVQTRRALSGVSATGGGIGDVSINARYDFISAGERRIPGLALLLGIVAPTGTPPESAGALSTEATGQGSWEGIAGVGIEQAFEPYFAHVNFAVGLRTSREVAGVRESFAPRFMGSVVAGRVFSHVTAGAFATGTRQGENRDDRGRIAGSDSSLLTVGIASAFAPSDNWRLQGTLSGNPPVSGWGRNQTAGLGASLSLIRLWL